MKGKIDSGQLCTVEPASPASLKVGDIVLCKLNAKQYLHLVKTIRGKRFQIGNNRGPDQRLGRREQHLRQMYQDRVIDRFMRTTMLWQVVERKTGRAASSSARPDNESGTRSTAKAIGLSAMSLTMPARY